jgi:hypothetical protein
VSRADFDGYDALAQGNERRRLHEHVDHQGPGRDVHPRVPIYDGPDVIRCHRGHCGIDVDRHDT